MPQPVDSRSGLLRWGIAVELSLACVAWAVGALAGFPPLQTIQFTAEALPDQVAAALWGIAATLPMLLVLVLIEGISWGPVRRLRDLVHQTIAPLFASEPIAHLALISAVAGLGEEMLFRGLLQAGLAAWIGGQRGVWLATLVASLAFGLAHAITWSYVVLATLIGAYLGWLFWTSGNLLAPIVAHASYDFLALLWLARRQSGTN